MLAVLASVTFSLSLQNWSILFSKPPSNLQFHISLTTISPAMYKIELLSVFLYKLQ
jgi:hypothetical protein